MKNLDRSAEQRLKELGINLPAPPEPFGTYVEAVKTGNLLFLTGMLPTEGRAAKFVGRVGAELDVAAGRKAAYLAALNVLAVARKYLGSLDKVKRIVRLGVSVATSGDVRDQPKVADAASEFLQDVFGKEKNPCVQSTALPASRSAHRWNWKSFSRWRRDAALPRGFDGFGGARITSIVNPRKGTSDGTPDFVSHNAD
jgi:enamine deaminase RidA (YjgF/YER057c/UK114 family)